MISDRWRAHATSLDAYSTIPIRAGGSLLSDVRDITATLDRNDRDETTRPLEPALAPAPEWVATWHDHGPMLLATARAITRDEAEAEDLVQTTFERALRAAPTIRDSRAVRAWLLTVETRGAAGRAATAPDAPARSDSSRAAGWRPGYLRMARAGRSAGQAVAPDSGCRGPPPHGWTLRARNGVSPGRHGEHSEGQAQDGAGATPGVPR